MSEILPYFYLLFKTIPLTFTALFPVVNPIGCSVMFLGLTPDADHKIRKAVAKKVGIYTFSILTISLFVGVYILKLFGISIPIIEVCGGLVLAIMGWNMLHESEEETAEKEHKIEAKMNLGNIYINKAFYPFTFPFTVGPGVIAVMLTVSAHIPNEELPIGILEWVGAVLGIALISFTVFFTYAYSEKVVQFLKPNIRNVIMRILSFIIFCIGGQILWNGAVELIEALPI